MKIGIDFDDVIVNFVDRLMDFYYTKYGKKVNIDEIEIFNWGIYWGVSREEATKRVDEFHETHDVKILPALDNAIYSLQKLMDKNEVFIITGRPIRFGYKIESWLEYHLKRKLRIIHAGEWHKGQAATKAEICKELKIPVLIEDSGETAVDCAENGIKVLLFDKPWNKKFSHKNIIRVQGWKEAMRELKNHIE